MSWPTPLPQLLSESAEVEACRERARAAGYEMKVNLEAVVGFVNRGQPQTDGTDAAGKACPSSKALVPRKPFDMTVNDRRFLRSLQDRGRRSEGRRDELEPVARSQPPSYNRHREACTGPTESGP